VKSQIWIAVSVYVLVAIVKKRLNLEASLNTLFQIFSLTLFEKMSIQQHLREETTFLKKSSTVINGIYLHFNRTVVIFCKNITSINILHLIDLYAIITKNSLQSAKAHSARFTR
jgi:hypothetical protein